MTRQKCDDFICIETVCNLSYLLPMYNYFCVPIVVLLPTNGTGGTLFAYRRYQQQKNGILMSIFQQKSLYFTVSIVFELDSESRYPITWTSTRANLANFRHKKNLMKLKKCSI